MPVTCTILLVSGSLRSTSTNTAVLRTAQEVGPEGVTVIRYDRLADLPHFNPDDDVEPLPSAVADLRSQIHAADAIIFSTPEYAGALPGSFKNLLDWTIGDDQPGAIYDKPVAWMNASPRGVRKRPRVPAQGFGIRPCGHCRPSMRGSAGHRRNARRRRAGRRPNDTSRHCNCPRDNGGVCPAPGRSRLTIRHKSPRIRRGLGLRNGEPNPSILRPKPHFGPFYACEHDGVRGLGSAFGHVGRPPMGSRLGSNAAGGSTATEVQQATSGHYPKAGPIGEGERPPYRKRTIGRMARS